LTSPSEPSDPVRVLRVVAGLDPAAGGPPRSTVAACLATQAQGAGNTLVFATGPAEEDAADDLLARLAAADVEVHGFPVAPRGAAVARRWGVSPALARWLWANARHDVIHVHGALGFATTTALLVGRLRGIPVVVSPHESLTDYDIEHSRTPLHGILKRALRALHLRAASLVVFASRLEAEDSCGRALDDDRRLVASHPVVESVAERRLGRHTNGLSRVGFMGRLHPKKNLDRLIEALPALPADVGLTVAGDGPPPERRRLDSLAEAKGVADRIEWRGWLGAQARDEFLGDLDLLAIPSAYECFGMAGAEALARGVPVLVSPTTGIAEIVERYRCGVVTATDPDALAAAIGELATHKPDLDELGAQALRAAESELSYPAFGSLVVSHYRRLAGAARVAEPASPRDG
jgi:glycosyltransferase involved in cell wall biosynthesis